MIMRSMPGLLAHHDQLQARGRATLFRAEQTRLEPRLAIAPGPDASHERARRPGGRAAARKSAQAGTPGRAGNGGPGPARMPWRPAVAGTASLGASLGMGILHPLLGEVIAIAETAAVLTVFAVALFGSKVLSERAFRLLRWLGNRPEQSAPDH
jgi:hypothetical protein